MTVPDEANEACLKRPSEEGPEMWSHPDHTQNETIIQKKKAQKP